jgi:hypothetical protein
MSPARRRTGAIGIAESLETYPVRIMRRPLHSTLTVLSCSGLHAVFEVFGVGACEVAASGLGYRRGREVVMKRFGHTVGSVGFLLLLVAFPLHAQQAEVTHNVNLRADPSTDNPPIRLLVPPERVERWVKGDGAPDVLVAVTKRSARILAVFEIDNGAWFTDPENRKKLVAVPVKDRSKPNFRRMQGKEYTGNRQGGAVRYGVKVS